MGGAFVIGPFMACAHPLSARQVLLLYLTAAWSLGMLESTAMTTDTLYFLTASQYRKGF